jgi:hypothetical protein
MGTFIQSAIQSCDWINGLNSRGGFFNGPQSAS